MAESRHSARRRTFQLPPSDRPRATPAESAEAARIAKVSRRHEGRTVDLPLESPVPPRRTRSRRVRQAQKTGHKLLAATFASLCTLGILAGTAVPAGTQLLTSQAEAERAQQALLLAAAGGSAFNVPENDPVAEETLPLLELNGVVVSLSELPDSKTRYPFDEEAPLTSGFGYRSYPVSGFHDAQDLAPGEGTLIRVVASGVVTEAGFSSDGWCGWTLTVQHRIAGQHVESRYCHMQASSHDYEVGDFVEIGDPAGRVGNTGLSFGAHLHLVIKVDGEPVNPLPFLAQHAAGADREE